MNRRDSFESSLALSVLTRGSRRACATPGPAAAKILETSPDINKLAAALTT
jgi:hypothetical protein